MSLGCSRVVVVDCDTLEQRLAFLADAGTPDDVAPTVTTPGQRGPDGNMVHSDGGHYWFTVPDGIDLPEQLGTLTDSAGGYAIMWGTGRYVLIPPSVRPEGPYTATGRVHPVPPWLRERISDHGQARVEQVRMTSPSSDDPVARWGASISWAEILEGTDWFATGRADCCGCEVWTAPGLHGSPKSATAHEPGCAEWTDSPDPCLHIWTDHHIEPFQSMVDTHGSHLTRLRAIAAIHHHNNIAAAMSALDLHADHPNLSASEADREAGSGDDPVTIGTATGLAVTYPPEFWDTRESLRRIRDAALAQRAAPDAALICVLARLSSRIPPGVRVSTGIMQPLPLNLFAALVCRTGKGKTSALSASAAIAEFDLDWPMDPFKEREKADEEVPVRWAQGDDFPREGKVRTGEGIAEMFYGKARRTNPITNKEFTERGRVRTNALMTTDEGAGLIKHVLDDKSIVGETLREAWSGSAIGQSNADADKYRYVPAGEYALGMIVGLHLSSLADLLSTEQLELGTPQRFLCAWSRPDRRVVTPERLSAPTEHDAVRITVPKKGLRLCQELRETVDAVHTAAWLSDDDGTEDSIESQRVAMIARTAALLAILDSRTDADETAQLIVTAQDWQLAETMFEASCAITRLAVEDRRAKNARRKRAERDTALAESIEDEDTRATSEGRAAARIVNYLTELGPRKHRWTGKNGIRAQNFNPKQVEDADRGLEMLTTGSKPRVRKTTERHGATFVELLW